MIVTDLNEYMQFLLAISYGFQNMNIKNYCPYFEGVASTDSACNIDLSFLYTMMDGCI